MSMFSGKCDFCDRMHIGNKNIEEVLEELNKTKVYISTGKDTREHRILMDTELDMARYYPYLISMMVGSKEGSVIFLSSSSFIDEEEKERLEWRLDDVLKYWRKCKRNKTPFNEEEAYEKCKFWGDDDVLKEIISRVAKVGDKADYKGLHLPMWEYYRKKWYEELVKLGETPIKAFCWCFNEFFPSKETVEKRLGKGIEYEEE